MWVARPPVLLSSELDGLVAAVVGAQPDQVVGGAGPKRDAVGLGLAVRELRQRRGVGGVQGGLRVRRVGHQDPVGGRHRGRLGGSAARRSGMEAVGGVAAGDADHGVVDGRLDEGHVQDGLDRLLGRVARQGGHGDRVPVRDDRRLASGRGRWRCRGRCPGKSEGGRPRRPQASRGSVAAGVGSTGRDLEERAHLAHPCARRIAVVGAGDSNPAHCSSQGGKARTSSYETRSRRCPRPPHSRSGPPGPCGPWIVGVKTFKVESAGRRGTKRPAAISAARGRALQAMVNDVMAP